MPELTLSVTVTRTLLSLGTLELNDHVNSYLAGSWTPGEVTWQRNSVSGPYVDDDFIVNQRRGKVTEEMVFEVLSGAADTSAQLEANLAAMVAAFTQDNYTLTVTADGVAYSWACSAANYRAIWNGPRLIAKQAQLQVSVPRSPVPLAGAF